MRIARTDLLIKKARSLSSNEDYGDDYGIPDSVFLEALNDAQLELQAAIVEEEACAFVAYDEIEPVANQSYISVPSDAFANNLVYEVAYSPDETEAQYYNLEDGMFREDTWDGEPEEYVVDGDRIYINGILNTARGMFRVRYEKGLDKLDIRRAVVLSAVYGDLGDTYVLPQIIGIDTSESYDADALAEAEYICINDSNGNVKARNIKIDRYDGSSGLYVETDFELEEGTVEIEEGDYVTIGEDTTTHSKLLYICQPYLVNAAAYDAIRINSSTDAPEQNQKLDRLMKRVLGVYSKLPGGKSLIRERRYR